MWLPTSPRFSSTITFCVYKIPTCASKVNSESRRCKFSVEKWLGEARPRLWGGETKTTATTTRRQPVRLGHVEEIKIAPFLKKSEKIYKKYSENTLGACEGMMYSKWNETCGFPQTYSKCNQILGTMRHKKLPLPIVPRAPCPR